MRISPVGFLTLTLVASACQCLQPVSSSVDGGPTGCRSDSDCRASGDCAVASCSAAGTCQVFNVGCDAGPTCGRAADCPGVGQPCDDASGASCGCGTVKTCVAGACRAYARECPPPVDAGLECGAPTDCAGPAGPAIRWCDGSTPARWSCAFGRCVTECGGSRTCVDDGGCVACDGQTRCAEARACSFGNALGVEEATCGITDYAIFVGTLSQPACTLRFAWPDGGVGGTVTWLEEGELTADIPDWGGRCVGRALPTGALRYSLSCPRCMASVRPEIIGP